jgi:uncharacterized membrane protein YeaQ/YmgE (transglycosylase-associated protein family)
MAPVYWIIVGLIGGYFTGRLTRFHTVHWGNAVDAVLGILGAFTGAAIYRGFGFGGGSHYASWGHGWLDGGSTVVALICGIVTTFICNDLARTRQEEIEEHVIVDHEAAYAENELSWEERLLHMKHDPMEGSVDPNTEDGHLRRDSDTIRDGKRIA